jgi:hypothetical protein
MEPEGLYKLLDRSSKLIVYIWHKNKGDATSALPDLSQPFVPVLQLDATHYGHCLYIRSCENVKVGVALPRFKHWEPKKANRWFSR